MDKVGCTNAPIGSAGAGDIRDSLADLDLARSFPAETCQRWCVLPFDRMSKSVLVATANPFNRQAAKDLEGTTLSRLVWYLCPPQDIMKGLKRAFH